MAVHENKASTTISEPFARTVNKCAAISFEDLYVDTVI